MKVELPNWLWALIIFDGVCVVLLAGVKFGGWALPGGLELLASPYASSVMSVVTLMAFGIWERKPGGVWDQYEVRRKEKEKQ